MTHEDQLSNLSFILLSLQEAVARQSYKDFQEKGNHNLLLSIQKVKDLMRCVQEDMVKEAAAYQVSNSLGLHNMS